MRITLGVVLAVGLAACGGGGKGADSPGTCPEGTVLKGSDCVPPGEGSSGGGGDTAKSGDEGEKPASGGGGGGGGSTSSAGDESPAPSGKTAYDKEAVEVQLKRAARQVKANCGSA